MGGSNRLHGDVLLTHTHTPMPRNCVLCNNARAILKRPKTGQQICKECFFYVFETEVHNTITDAELFKRGDRVAIGASGGKGAFDMIHTDNHTIKWFIDSTVLAYVMKTLNDRYDYGLELYLLSIDEGITGYRDDSLEVTKVLQLLRSYVQALSRLSKEIKFNTICRLKYSLTTNYMVGRWMR